MMRVPPRRPYIQRSTQTLKRYFVSGTDYFDDYQIDKELHSQGPWIRVDDLKDWIKEYGEMESSKDLFVFYDDLQKALK